MKKLISLLLTVILTLSIAIVPASAGSSSEQGVGEFVTRLYDICLNRQPDAAGYTDWTSKLLNNEITGAECAYGFIFSDEFQSLNVTNDQYVELMYSCFFGRASDPEGKSDWVGKLNSGITRKDLFAGFANSREFDELCATYGIMRGSYDPARNSFALTPNRAQIEAFVTRLYDTFLNRLPDEAGLNDWVDQIAAGKITGSQAAYGFIFSPEYKALNKPDNDFVTDLYVGFLGRTPDQAGLNDWVSQIAGGRTDLDIFNGFAGSQEWIGLCRGYGIEAGGNVSGELYARSGTHSDVSNDPTSQGEGNNDVVVLPDVGPFTQEITHTINRLATCDGITFMEVSTYDGYNGNTYTDLYSYLYGKVDSNECCVSLELTIYVSGKVDVSDLYIKYKGDEGFRDLGSGFAQYIPNAASAKVIASTAYYEGEEPFSMTSFSDQRYEYMSEKGYDKYIVITIEFGEPGLQQFDLYYKGHKIKTIEYTNDQNGTLVYSENARGILSDILKYKPNMSDLELIDAACYWIRNHSYYDYTCWGCHSVEAVMNLRGYTSISLACSYNGENGVYNDYSRYYSLSPIREYGSDENSVGHHISIIFIDPTHYVLVQVQGSHILNKGETDFSTPWTPNSAVTHSVFEEFGSLRDYDNIYDLVLGDYGIDLKRFDPYDCRTWY